MNENFTERLTDGIPHEVEAALEQSAMVEELRPAYEPMRKLSEVPTPIGFRHDIVNDEHPRWTIDGEKPSPVKVGDEFILVTQRCEEMGTKTPQTWIVVTGISKSAKGDHVIEYQVRDDRALYLASSTGKDPEYYTRSRSRAIDREAGVEHDPEAARRYSTRARVSRANRPEHPKARATRIKDRILSVLSGLSEEAQEETLQRIEAVLREMEASNGA